MTSIPNNDSNIPLFSQRLASIAHVPAEGYGVVADQTVTKLSFVKANEGGEGGDFSLEIDLVPHNMRCEPPRGYNR